MRDHANIIRRFSTCLVLAAALLLLVFAASPVAAQSYRFSVEQMNMQVFVQPDASARVVYDITFRNGLGAHAIDIVDVGLPHENYDLGNMVASVDGAAVTDIRPSELVKPGVEIHLGGKAIPASERGTLHFEFTSPDMVYQDVTNKENASLQITPTWFGDEFVSGTTDLRIAIHMLEGINPDEVLYQKEPFTDKAIFRGRTVAVWEFPNVRLTGPHLVGVSFPQFGLTRVVRQSLWQLTVRWFEETPGVRTTAFIVSVVAFSFLFLRFSGGTGYSVWIALLVAQIYLFIKNPAAHLLSFIPLVVLLIANESHRSRRKRRYLPAIAQVEGGGIKRGLTAPEAAVLLELPVNKVLTLIIFGMLKKGILQQVQDSPLMVEVVEEFRTRNKLVVQDKRSTYRRQAAQEKGIVLHKYEQDFLDVLETEAGTPVHKIDLSQPMKAFLQHTAKRVKGFDLSDTQDYYRSIVKRALTEARSMGEVPEREETLDRNFEWILMGDEGEYRPVFDSPRYPYRPIWTRPIISAGGGRPPTAPRPPSSRTGGATPSFSDVAAGFAGWAENTMGRMASAITPGSLQLEGATGGVLNLSGFDEVTGDIFEALASSSGGSSSGGGGSCACACAGCACACACAGGGR